MMAGVGKGVIRVVKGNPDAIATLIPVDKAINMMIAVAYQTALQRYLD